MSVNYESALIYDYNCSNYQDEWSSEELERMKKIGWDIIRDAYSDEFLYIGKIISQVEVGQKARIYCLKDLEQIKNNVNALFIDTPIEMLSHLPIYRTMYHLCYAT